MVVEDRDGKAVLQFSFPIQELAMQPQAAFEIAESLSRAAHAARFPGEPQPDGSYLAQQIRARVTDELRDRMITRAALVLNNMFARNWTPGKAAVSVVDIVLNMAQGKEVV